MKKIIFTFELDNTLWNCSGGNHDKLEQPFEKKSVISGLIRDRTGRKLYPYPEIKRVLEQIKSGDYSIAFTSTTQNPECTHKLTKITGIDNYPDFNIFNSKSKKEQMEMLILQAGCNPENIIYFDSSRNNILNIRPLGINAFLIPDEGLTHDTFILAMKNVSMWMDIDELGITWGSIRKAEDAGFISRRRV